MTCQECQPLAIDLARSLPPFDVGGAVERADVLSHVATCKRCAQWLREQEALSNALRTVAAADASLAAPPAVEANVMAAFRARQSSSPPAWTWRSAWPTGRAAGFAAVAAAAVVVAAFTLAAVRWLNPPLASNGSTTNAANASTPSPLPSPLPPAAGRSAERASGQSGESAGARITSTGTNAAVIEVLPEKGRKTTKGRPAPPRATATRVAAVRGLAAHTTRSVNVARGASEFSEPAFVLLPYTEPLRPTEMRHIMRVRMTRAQFAAAELQADVDDSTVLADVLVGEDGTARAVRIVQ